MRVHGRTETNGGRSAERPTRSRTGQLMAVQLKKRFFAIGELILHRFISHVGFDKLKL